MHRFDIYLQINMLKIWEIKWENIDMIIGVNNYFTNIIKENFKLTSNVITLNNYISFPYENKINIDNKNIYNIGIIGINRKLKRLDLAIDILNILRGHDPNYKLFSKGHSISLSDSKETLTLLNNKDLTNYFHEDHSDINNISVNQWIINNNISHILSVSDIECFHYSIISAIENNCNYYITNWIDVAKTIWNSDCIYNNIDEIVDGILYYAKINDNEKIKILSRNKNYCVNNFEFNNSATFLDKLI